MKVFYFIEVVEFLNKLSVKERSRIDRTREYFEKYGFGIGPKYVKKIKPSLWELRSGRVRIFICAVKDRAVGVHVILKKSQKIPLYDIKLAEKRSKEI